MRRCFVSMIVFAARPALGADNLIRQSSCYTLSGFVDAPVRGVDRIVTRQQYVIEWDSLSD